MSRSTDNMEHTERAQPAKGPEREIDENHPLEGVMETLEGTAEQYGDGQLSVGEVVDAYGRRSYGPSLAAPAVIALLPLVGGIPGVSIVTATIILLVSFQMLIWNEGVWLPKKLRDMHVKSRKVAKGAEKSKSWVSAGDSLISPRLAVLTKAPFSYLIPLVCILLAISMYPLAAVPFGVAPPALAILILAVAIIAHDGALLLVGYVAAVGATGAAWYLLGG